MKNSFELSMNFFRKNNQFFMSDFLHSKFPKRRRVCGMSRAVKFWIFNNELTKLQKSLEKNVEVVWKNGGHISHTAHKTHQIQ